MFRHSNILIVHGNVIRIKTKQAIEPEKKAFQTFS